MGWETVFCDEHCIKLTDKSKKGRVRSSCCQAGDTLHGTS